MVRDTLKRKAEKHGHSRRGGERRSEYVIWSCMLSRCLDENCRSYYKYGALGVSVSEEWLSYTQFFADMGERPSIEHSIDRIDVYGNYCKENCRWATKKEQANNKRNSVYLTVDDRTQTLAQWADEFGVDYHAMYWRYENNWTHHECVYGKADERAGIITFAGITQFITLWAEVLGVSKHTIASRKYHNGWCDDWCLFGNPSNPRSYRPELRDAYLANHKEITDGRPTTDLC